MPVKKRRGGGVRQPNYGRSCLSCAPARLHRPPQCPNPAHETHHKHKSAGGRATSQPPVRGRSAAMKMGVAQARGGGRGRATAQPHEPMSSTLTCSTTSQPPRVQVLPGDESPTQQRGERSDERPDRGTGRREQINDRQTPECRIVVLRSTHTGSAHRTGDSARVGAPSAVDTWASPLGGCGRYSALTAANGRRKCSLKAHGRVRCPPSQPQRHGLVCVGVSPLGTTATPDGVIASQISTARKVATTFRRVGDLSRAGKVAKFFLPGALLGVLSDSARPVPLVARGVKFRGGGGVSP